MGNGVYKIAPVTKIIIDIRLSLWYNSDTISDKAIKGGLL